MATGVARSWPDVHDPRSANQGEQNRHSINLLLLVVTSNILTYSREIEISATCDYCKFFDRLNVPRASMLFVLLLLSTYLVDAKTWTVTTERVNSNKPVIGHGADSTFDWNYNAAFVRSAESPMKGGILVRCQNRTSKTDLYAVGPSYMVYTPLLTDLTDLSEIKFAPIDDSRIVIGPTDKDDSAFGVEDPRSTYDEKEDTHYIHYSAVSKSPVISRLSLATVKSASVANASEYQLRGPIFDKKTWSKSGALLIRKSNQKSYLYWGDSSFADGMFLASSRDLLHYTNSRQVFLPKRANMWDSALVEGGPHPFVLSDGNYLMLYNSARNGFPSKKPGWDVQYNVGYVILDKKDPKKILYRSEQPIFSPELDWEKDEDSLTPNVVFIEGWTRLAEPDTFLFFYGAADSLVGAAKLTVKIR
ncbi:hypothetical protein PROFUN_03840 [Planoprotostelium fungivorum]|uniref:Glycosidase n=1 Tax=Planoprotostelium fungivorum TaxID=1890364 RepID=A0A2P6NIA3_9EUKA|nr:hypothetical protein PROFUN_03840 [Planoprotostelium fungivorum]